MARYFFNMIDGMFLTDFVGETFETIEDAQRHAVRVGVEAIAKYGPSFWSHHGLRIVVTNEGGVSLFDLNLVGRSLDQRPLSQR